MWIPKQAINHQVEGIQALGQDTNSRVLRFKGKDEGWNQSKEGAVQSTVDLFTENITNAGTLATMGKSMHGMLHGEDTWTSPGRNQHVFSVYVWLNAGPGAWFPQEASIGQ